MKRKAPPSPRDVAKRAALNALKKARRAADKAGVELSAWEGEFLESVGERLKTYGRAFADPDKGAPGTALSALQGRKLKEISAKAQGKGLDKDEDKARDKPARRFGPKTRAGGFVRGGKSLARQSLADDED